MQCKKKLFGKMEILRSDDSVQNPKPEDAKQAIQDGLGESSHG